jgi:solute carrier family 10 (sodium/bile acid cotransporter), member 7
MSLRRLPVDGFLLAIGAAIALAAFAPAVGARGGPLRLDILSGAAISLVFFLHGAGLPLEALASGVRAVRVHILVQATTWLVFPVIGALLLALAGSALPAGLALGFFLLCAVSSTISSSVAMTAVAGGNVAAALFNATLSGVLGTVLTPLYLGLVAHTSGVGGSLPDAIGQVALRVLLPLVLGQLARPLIGALLMRHRSLVGFVDRSSIVLIVYGAFCDSILADVWTRSSAGAVLTVALLAAALFALVTLSLQRATRWLGLDRSDAITAVFCGSQKSLANGLSIARVMFGGSPALGFIVLPLIVYHQLQLMIGATMARRHSRDWTQQ